MKTNIPCFTVVSYGLEMVCDYCSKKLPANKKHVFIRTDKENIHACSACLSLMRDIISVAIQETAE